MILPIIAVIFGLALLVWSADKFVDGAVGVAKFCGMSTFLIGVVIVGFGTSAPELTVSAISAAGGNPELALGNAYGSNIANIAFILGATALVSPVLMRRSVIKGDLPILIGVSLLSFVLILDESISRINGLILLIVFALTMAYSIYVEKKKAKNESEEKTQKTSLAKALFTLIMGLVLLVLSSRILVWGAVAIAKSLGVSDLLIGLTIVAVGTSLPELASSIAAAKKGENDLALGNIIGSNLFNTLAVVGIAAVISPMANIDKAILCRDMPLMILLTLSLLILGFRRKGDGKLNRMAGIILLLVYISYIAYLVLNATH